VEVEKMEIGQVCVKIAGRDAGSICLVIDTIDHNFVVVDGQCRRRKCNIKHLEPLEKRIEIKRNASHEEVLEALKGAGFEINEAVKKSEKKEKPPKPVSKRKSSVSNESAESKTKKQNKAKEK
jgi:large subunit ribosomal protein L14e